MNGIRDDVEAYINIHYTGNTGIFMRGIAKNYQSALTSADDQSAMRAADQIGRYGDCLYQSSPNSFEDMERIEAEIMNTRQRLAAYSRFDSRISGNTFSLPSQQERSQFCQLSVSNSN